MKTVEALETRLGELHQRTRETPLFNPVFQLSLDLSRALEGGELTLDDLTALVAELECDGLKARARKLRSLLDAPAAPAASAGAEEDFASFAAGWERPQLHAVFTAHPTFLLSPAQGEAVAAAASATGDVDDAVCAVPPTCTAVTLEDEHRAALAAMAREQPATPQALANLRAELGLNEPALARYFDWLGGILHGGAIMAFADTLGAIGAFLNLPEGAQGTTTIESKTNFLSPAKEGSLVKAETTPVNIGRRLSVWQTRISREDGKAVALVTQTQLVL